jgi:CRP/FNR family transcriptional regulator, cyclic AMP receptor protein
MNEAGFLGFLDDEERSDLEGRGRKRSYRRNMSVLNEGDTTGRVVVLIEGRVKATYFTEDGKEVLLAIREPGDLLGEFSALDGEPHSASAIALEPVEALVLSAEDFRGFLADNPRVSLYLLESLTRRLRDADAKRVEFLAYDSVGRVARRLVELADRFGRDAEDGETQITVKLTQEELAGWAGCSREAASKALQALRARGWVETHRRGVTILDLDALVKRAS